MRVAQSRHEVPPTPFIQGTPQAAGTHGEELQTSVPSYPSLWRMWNSRCVVSLTGQSDRQQQAPGPTKELIRGSPIPVRARDDDDSTTVLDAPPRGSARKFTMDQFQREFGPCLTYSAPASPLRKRFSIESAETIPLISPHPRRFVEPTFAAPADAAAAVPAILGTGGWRPVTGRFSLDSSSPPRRWDNQPFSYTSSLPLARRPLSSLDNLTAERARDVKFSESADESGCCFIVSALDLYTCESK